MNQQNHALAPEEMMAYLDGELSPERAAATAAHLMNCKECQARRDQLSAVSSGLLAWEVEAGNAGIPKAIADALDARERQQSAPVQIASSGQYFWTDRKTLRRMAWPLAGASALAALLIAAWIPNLLRSRSPMQAYLQPKKGAETYITPSLVPNESSAVKQRYGTAAAPPPPPVAGLAADSISPGVLDGNAAQETDGEEPKDNIVLSGPMIVRSAQLTVTMKDFDLARQSVDDILKRYHGYIGDLTVSTPNGSARSINAKLRIPSAQLDAALSALKALGRVETEAQNGEEVTQQYVDLNARLSNARKTQQRLLEIQRDRTGKLSDVLSVEMQISRVQGEIEQMEAQLKTLKNQISFASLDLTIAERYKAELKVVPPSLGDQLRNAAIDGFRSIRDTVISVLFWLLSTGPILLFWVLILFYPVRLVWKKLKPRLVPGV